MCYLDELVKLLYKLYCTCEKDKPKRKSID